MSKSPIKMVPGELPTIVIPTDHTITFNEMVFGLLDDAPAMTYASMKSIIGNVNPLRIALLPEDKKAKFKDFHNILSEAEKTGIALKDNYAAREKLDALLNDIVYDPNMRQIAQKVCSNIMLISIETATIRSGKKKNRTAALRFKAQKFMLK